jgi:hypothetical protein
LLLTARDLVALIAGSLLEPGEARVDVGERPARLARGDLGELDVFRNGKVREDPPLLGDEGDPEPSEPERGGTQPTILLRTVVFPAPLRPSSATVSPRRTSKLKFLRIWLSP